MTKKIPRLRNTPEKDVYSFPRMKDARLPDSSLSMGEGKVFKEGDLDNLTLHNQVRTRSNEFMLDKYRFKRDKQELVHKYACGRVEPR